MLISEAREKAIEALKVAQTREAVRELLAESVQKYGLTLNPDNEQDSWPFLAVASGDNGIGGYSYHTLQRNIKGNHPVSFFEPDKNRLDLTDIERETRRLWAADAPLKEVEDDYEDTHSHELWFCLGKIEGQELYIQIANKRYTERED